MQCFEVKKNHLSHWKYVLNIHENTKRKEMNIMLLHYALILIMPWLRRKIIKDICQPTEVCVLECKCNRLGQLWQGGNKTEVKSSLWSNHTTRNSNRLWTNALQNWELEKMTDILTFSSYEELTLLLKKGEEEEGSTKREGKSFIHQEHTLAKIAAEGKNQASCYFYIPLTFLYLSTNPYTPVVWPGRRTAWASLCTATAMAWWTKFSQLGNCILVCCAVTNSEMSQRLLFWNEDPSLPGLLSFIFKFKLNWVSLWATAAVPSSLPGLTSPPAPPLTAPAAVSSHPIGSTSSNIWAAPLLVALILQTTSGN